MENILAIADFASALRKLTAKAVKAGVSPVQVDQVFMAVTADLQKEPKK